VSNWNDAELGVPDFIEPIRLYRYFRPGTPRDVLSSISHSVRWLEPEMEARCMPMFGGCAHREHQAPDKHHRCGLYGYYLPDTWNWTVLYGPRTEVFAAVEATGRVIVHPLGMRVQKQRIVALALDNAVNLNRHVLDNWRDRYKVPLFESPEELTGKFPPQDLSVMLGASAETRRREHFGRESANPERSPLYWRSTSPWAITGMRATYPPFPTSLSR
jgi:hypothetical protein